VTPASPRSRVWYQSVNCATRSASVNIATTLPSDVVIGRTYQTPRPLPSMSWTPRFAEGRRRMADLARLPWRLRYSILPKLASRRRRLGVLATHLHADVQIDRSAMLGPRFSVWIPGAGHLSIGPGSQFRRDFYAEIHGDGRVEIGPGTIFTGQCTLQISTSLVTGSRCVLGVGTFVADGNHRFKDHTKHLLDQGYDFSPVTIGDGAIVMSKCTI